MLPRPATSQGEAPIPLWLGIDVGGTKVAFALGDEEGHLRATHRRPTEPSGDPDRDVARLAEDALRIVEKAGARTQDVAAVGVSLPGPLDREAGRILHPPNLPGWGEVQVRDPLVRALGRPVHLENDANAAALAEWRFGAGRGASHLVYLTMSTGIGGGLVLGGRLHRGVRTSAGEFGHVPLSWEDDAERCACGLRGCLEAYIGGASLARRLRAVTPAESRVAELAGGRENATPVHLVAAAKEGDAFARAEMERFTHCLARAIVTIAFALAPEIVVLGTIAVAAGEELLFEPLRARVRERAWPQVTDGLRIVPAALGAELPYLAGIGAAVEGAREL